MRYGWDKDSIPDMEQIFLYLIGNLSHENFMLLLVSLILWGIIIVFCIIAFLRKRLNKDRKWLRGEGKEVVESTIARIKQFLEERNIDYSTRNTSISVYLLDDTCEVQLQILGPNNFIVWCADLGDHKHFDNLEEAITYFFSLVDERSLPDQSV